MNSNKNGHMVHGDNEFSPYIERVQYTITMITPKAYNWQTVRPKWNHLILWCHHTSEPRVCRFYAAVVCSPVHQTIQQILKRSLSLFDPKLWTQFALVRIDKFQYSWARERKYITRSYRKIYTRAQHDSRGFC